LIVVGAISCALASPRENGAPSLTPGEPRSRRSTMMIVPASQRGC
jgi:hypothetical protein